MSDLARELALRLSAWSSVLLFLGAFSGEALRALWPAALTRWLEARRRSFTLGFVVTHTLHLVAIASLASARGGGRFVHETDAFTLYGGAAIYVTIYGLGAAALRGATPSAWQSAGMYVVGAAFARPFLLKALEGRSAWGLAVTLVFVAALTARVVVAVRSRRQRPRAVNAPDARVDRVDLAGAPLHA